MSRPEALFGLAIPSTIAPQALAGVADCPILCSGLSLASGAPSRSRMKLDRKCNSDCTAFNEDLAAHAAHARRTARMFKKRFMYIDTQAPALVKSK
jgi:hypothetical protein